MLPFGVPALSMLVVERVFLAWCFQKLKPNQMGQVGHARGGFRGADLTSWSFTLDVFFAASRNVIRCMYFFALEHEYCCCFHSAFLTFLQETERVKSSSSVAAWRLLEVLLGALKATEACCSFSGAIGGSYPKEYAIQWSFAADSCHAESSQRWRGTEGNGTNGGMELGCAAFFGITSC